VTAPPSVVVRHCGTVPYQRFRDAPSVGACSARGAVGGR
jgi:hypothetical protein